MNTHKELSRPRRGGKVKTSENPIQAMKSMSKAGDKKFSKMTKSKKIK